MKGPIGPISIMFIVYGVVVQGPAGASIKKLLLSGVFAEILLLLFQGATVYVVVGLALFWYGSLAPRELPGVIAAAGLETGIVMLLIGTSSVLANVLFIED